MTIKTTAAGLIILKNGKPSCECCGECPEQTAICITFNDSAFGAEPITLTGSLVAGSFSGQNNYGYTITVAWDAANSAWRFSYAGTELVTIPDTQTAIYTGETERCIPVGMTVHFEDPNVIITASVDFFGSCDGCIIDWGTPASNGMEGPDDPWSFEPDGSSIRFDFEDSAGIEDPDTGSMIGACGDAINPNTQTGEAVGTFESPFDTIMTVTVIGQGETVSEEYELLDVYIDSTLVINAHAPGGGGESCATGASVVEPVTLPPGDPLTTGGVSHPDYFLAGGVPHTITLQVNSRDEQWHENAFYEITFTCRAPDTPE